MNIFVVDSDPCLAARMLCNEHIIKMSTETAQILSTVSWRYGVAADYKPTHQRVPSVLWPGETLQNWKWLIKHGLTLCDEYTRRYGKIHKSEAVLRNLLYRGGRPISGDLTPWPQTMPDKYKEPDTIKAYRAFYCAEKSKFATWEPYSQPPSWYLPAPAPA